jgi:hypothetical protein
MVRSKFRSQVSGLFIFGSGVALFITGAAKLLSAGAGGPSTTAMDPVFAAPLSRILIVAGVAELCVCAVCIFSHIRRMRRVSLILIAWLASVFACYRAGLWWLGWKGPCRCLGTLTESLHMAPWLADDIMIGVLAYLLLGSYWFLASGWAIGKTEKRRLRGRAFSPDCQSAR